MEKASVWALRRQRESGGEDGGDEGRGREETGEERERGSRLKLGALPRDLALIEGFLAWLRRIALLEDEKDSLGEEQKNRSK